MPYSFVFDANRCTGCQACQLACVIENDLDFGSSWRLIHTFNERHLPGIPLFHLSLACNHCAEPACLHACPALAYSKDAATGAVLIDPYRCIGCGYCSWACPYDAPRFDRDSGVMTKCTFCNDRIHGGGGPACAELCPTGALRFEQLAPEEITNDVEGFPQSDLAPSIRILPLREGRREPLPHDEAPAIPSDLSRLARAEPRASLRSEWTLAIFTLLAAALVAWLVSTAAGGPKLHSVVFLGASTLAMAFGTLHLGQKARAWRAILGFRRSWLSREIAFFSAFVATGATSLLGVPGSGATGVAAVLLGIAALFSMDRVYGFRVRDAVFVPHSASVLLTGFLLAGVLLEQPLLAGIVGAAKMVLYVSRKIGFLRSGRRVLPWVTASRIAFGFLLPAIVWVTAPAGGPILTIVSVLLGESIDRCEFYTELDFPSPARQMTVDLATRVIGQKER